MGLVSVNKVGLNVMFNLIIIDYFSRVLCVSDDSLVINISRMGNLFAEIIESERD